ncbi:MAG: phage major tail tube protein [Novosphingobium sp. 28-62-57]|uniref:phage major tail tube protein n=1 Tax=unclassified Novosphingobium TaxID=2644732 RepID=UPI000BC4621F|nr:MULTISPECIES: phage major tail tube protein [unclassified Novosphingobium]OYW47325.1 MAG: phage major tail tube protein [Novosphingobium sp. 12-63-9]OYZ07993.1 MAG: phage major tail tube protein [Novosphingobium sp. 28-62-57]HQS69250.1 phage major tail tube protein [Novosphingobium sp.]
MGLPRKLKNLNAFVDGESYIGVISEFEEPKLAIATEEWRGGGMLGPVMLDMGLEAMEAALTMGGHEAALIRKFGTTRVDGVRLRLVGAYQADNGGAAQAVEVYIGGRFTEIDPGKSKAGDSTEQKYKVPLAYYRRVVDGRIEIEIDMLRGIFIVDGVDRYAEIMAIISS